MTDIPEDEMNLTAEQLMAAVDARPDEGNHFYGLCSAYQARGYVIEAYPFPSTYDIFCAGAREGIDRIDEAADWARKEYGYRGWSKRLIEHLHDRLPEPFFGASPDTVAYPKREEAGPDGP